MQMRLLHQSTMAFDKVFVLRDDAQLCHHPIVSCQVHVQKQPQEETECGFA